MCKLCDAEGALLGEMERVVLENRSEGHNKEYTVFIEQIGGEQGYNFRVMARWGPIGKWQKSQQKALLVSLSNARNEVYDLVSKKEKRGYVRRRCDGVAAS